jgi:hypothetical protein
MSDSDDDFEFDFDEDDDLPLPDDSNIPAMDKEVMFGIAFCNYIVNKLMDDFGEEAILDLLFAIDRNMGWSSEILANRYEVDNILLSKYGAFDQHIWYKVQDTKAWAKMHRQVYKMSRRYLAAAVDEVVQEELLDTQ